MEGASPSTASYEKAKARVAKATGNFAGVETIGAKDVLQLKNEGKRVVLVDVRTEEEMKVSMLRGALTREEFESSNLGEPVRTGKKFLASFSDGEQAWDVDVVVPYCTVGFRSGQYAKKLMGLGYPSVKNSEGVVLWTHEIGSGLVARNACAEDSASDAEHSPGDDADTDTDAGVEVKRVHVFGSPWDHASEEFETVKFSAKGWLGSNVKSAFSTMFRKKKT
eukprot:g15410.t1